MEKLSRIVHFGMGGSAIAADYLQTVVTEAQGPPGRSLSGGSGIPGRLMTRPLVICSSYSGNTEETLSAFDLELRGCKVAVTAGGRLEEIATEYGITIYGIKHSI